MVKKECQRTEVTSVIWHIIFIWTFIQKENCCVLALQYDQLHVHRRRT